MSFEKYTEEEEEGCVEEKREFLGLKYGDIGTCHLQKACVSGVNGEDTEN